MKKKLLLLVAAAGGLVAFKRHRSNKAEQDLWQEATRPDPELR